MCVQSLSVCIVKAHSKRLKFISTFRSKKFQSTKFIFFFFCEVYRSSKIIFFSALLTYWYRCMTSNKINICVCKSTLVQGIWEKENTKEQRSSQKNGSLSDGEEDEKIKWKISNFSSSSCLYSCSRSPYSFYSWMKMKEFFSPQPTGRNTKSPHFFYVETFYATVEFEGKLLCKQNKSLPSNLTVAENSTQKNSPLFASASLWKFIIKLFHPVDWKCPGLASGA